jgi:hypothetical protein
VADATAGADATVVGVVGADAVVSGVADRHREDARKVAATAVEAKSPSGSGVASLSQQLPIPAGEVGLGPDRVPKPESPRTHAADRNAPVKTLDVAQANNLDRTVGRTTDRTVVHHWLDDERGHLRAGPISVNGLRICPHFAEKRSVPRFETIENLIELTNLTPF